MNSSDRTHRSFRQPHSAMWLEILGVILGLAALSGLALLRAELRDRVGGQLDNSHTEQVAIVDVQDF